MARARSVLSRDDVGALLRALRADGHVLLGPTVRDGAIVCGELRGIDDLPAGQTADQEAGTYRLRRRDDAALFGFAVGPQSYKHVFFPPRSCLWRGERDAARGFTTATPPVPRQRLALIGARACDLAALDIHDRVFVHCAYPDRDYAARRADVFVVAVHCTVPAATCFCTSMGTGPRATSAFDLALAELLDGGHRFVVDCGSPAGEARLAALGARPATRAESDAADAAVATAAAAQSRRLDAAGVRDLLLGNGAHPRWDDVAARCLACGNCALVCPTCFCWTVEEVADLRGDHAERWRVWDTCFSADHSHVHGGSVRASTRARYRQWLTHKLATWHDQFGTSGCVGCGRCIVWCPVGIDLTAEVAAIAADDGAGERA